MVGSTAYPAIAIPSANKTRERGINIQVFGVRER
jgi:hypothetical protein